MSLALCELSPMPYLFRSSRLGWARGGPLCFPLSFLFVLTSVLLKDSSLLICPFSFQKKLRLSGHFQFDPKVKISIIL